MRRERKQHEPDSDIGAPNWMLTFSDCMTLLLTFFVLLLSFSSFDDRLFYKLKVIFAKQLPSLSSETARDKDAFLDTMTITYNKEIDKGSEKPTLAERTEDNLKEDTENFQKRKVFLIPSDEIFWGNGTVISFHGRKVLSDMASFLKEVPNRMVISENTQAGPYASTDLGLRRAWAVTRYLTRKRGLDKKQFSISAASTVTAVAAKQDAVGSEQSLQTKKAERTLEIVLLERSIYN